MKTDSAIADKEFDIHIEHNLVCGTEFLIDNVQVYVPDFTKPNEKSIQILVRERNEPENPPECRVKQFVVFMEAQPDPIFVKQADWPANIREGQSPSGVVKTFLWLGEKQ